MDKGEKKGMSIPKETLPKGKGSSNSHPGNVELQLSADITPEETPPLPKKS